MAGSTLRQDLDFAPYIFWDFFGFFFGLLGTFKIILKSREHIMSGPRLCSESNAGISFSRSQADNQIDRGLILN